MPSPSPSPPNRLGQANAATDVDSLERKRKRKRERKAAAASNAGSAIADDSELGAQRDYGAFSAGPAAAAAHANANLDSHRHRAGSDSRNETRATTPPLKHRTPLSSAELPSTHHVHRHHESAERTESTIGSKHSLLSAAGSRGSSSSSIAPRQLLSEQRHVTNQKPVRRPRQTKSKVDLHRRAAALHSIGSTGSAKSTGSSKSHNNATELIHNQQADTRSQGFELSTLLSPVSLSSFKSTSKNTNSFGSNSLLSCTTLAGNQSHLTHSQPLSNSKQLHTQQHHKMADQAIIDKLEAGFAKLQATTPEQCHSLLKKYLTREVLDKLKTKKTAMGATLLDVCQSGFENLDSGVGIYAPDAESYTLFADLFNPIIEDYHGGFKATDKHPQSDFGDLESLVNVDPNNEFVISTRVRCGRSLKGYPFNPCLTEAQYKEMEEKVSGALKGMDGDLAGTYHPLTGMTKETQQQLIDDHFLFKEGDRFLQAANACRYWPTGRGIFHNSAKSFLVWVNEEDHLRIISMQKGGDLKEVFSRMVRGARAIEAKAAFSRDDRLGFLTFCPTNLGTTIRASVHIKLPKLAADRKKLEEVAGKFNLQVRGTSGEHTESIGGIYDISNKRRLGLTEYQAVREMQDGILELIKIEKSL